MGLRAENENVRSKSALRESFPQKKEKKGEGGIFLSPRPSIGVYETEKVEIYNFNFGID